VLDKDLVRGLSEKEVEIEHLKTTIIALTEKIVVTYSCLTPSMCEGSRGCQKRSLSQ
jgi:hypothetical protein